MGIKILLADDDNALRRVLAFKLTQRGYAVRDVPNGNEALAAIAADQFALMLSDIRMPGLTGLSLLKELKKKAPGLPVILMTAYAEVREAVEAVKQGAFDYLTKPFEDDELFVAIDKAVQFSMLQQENKHLKEKLEQARSEQEPIGVSPLFRELMATVDKIAPSDATVLIYGESGTGKEVIAREIHSRSGRKFKPFIGISCAAIPKDLLESELFGYVKGAFTGASKDKRGKFELADSGTLFLDDVGETNFELQAKLLRAIQERTIDPVGSEEYRAIDVRLIAATNVPLKERVAAGTFREDLYYRLNVIPLIIPPLRDRGEDIALLAQEFARHFAKSEPVTLSAELIQALEQYRWPGNVRELENLIERMVVLRQGNKLSLRDLPKEYRSGSADIHVSDQAWLGNGEITFHDAERKLISDALERAGGNKSKAAAQLRIPRHVFIYRMKKYGIPG